jgi:hypothetical protein
MAIVGRFYSSGIGVNKAIEFASLEAAEATYSNSWNFEIVYQDSNGEWS